MKIVEKSSYERHTVDALASGVEEGRDKLRKVACIGTYEKPWGAANRPRSTDIRMGQPSASHVALPERETNPVN